VTYKPRELDWNRIEGELEEFGFAKIPPLLSPDECRELIDLYPDDSRFRSRIEMARYKFGVGEYKYFSYPLPAIVEDLRHETYPNLPRIANRWASATGSERSHPANLESFLATCHRHGQKEPTPLLLRYETGGYNCLHQDLYGDIAFPLQMTVC
jgi:hypothetical protein